MERPKLTAKLVKELAGLAGLELSVIQARPLIAVLESIAQGDAEIAKLELGNLSPVGSTWAGEEDD